MKKGIIIHFDDRYIKVLKCEELGDKIGEFHTFIFKIPKHYKKPLGQYLGRKVKFNFKKVFLL